MERYKPLARMHGAGGLPLRAVAMRIVTYQRRRLKPLARLSPVSDIANSAAVGQLLLRFRLRARVVAIAHRIAPHRVASHRAERRCAVAREVAGSSRANVQGSGSVCDRGTPPDPAREGIEMGCLPRGGGCI
jgi:hypothetical protein